LSEHVGVSAAPRVLSAWQRLLKSEERPSINLVIRSAAGADCFEVVEAGVREVLAALGGAKNFALVPAPRGLVLAFTYPDHLDAFLDALSVNLARRGLVGEIDLVRSERPTLARNQDLLECRVRLHGHQEHVTWQPEESAARDALVLGARFVEDLSGLERLFFVPAVGVSLRVEPGVDLFEVRRLPATPGPAPLNGQGTKPFAPARSRGPDPRSGPRATAR
jgi:hypothetical protein